MTAFPGATAVTWLDVYDWDGPDGLAGGSPHLHMVCTEGYLVVGGSGRLQTLGPKGFRTSPLRVGETIWFTPGTIHRLINDDGLRIAVVMQNAGLPELGDAVMTFPLDVVSDRARYLEAASLADAGRSDASSADAARRRRDLAIAGFVELREAGNAGLQSFYAAARSLVADRLDEWERRWEEGPSAVAAATGRQIAALRNGDLSHLGDADVYVGEAPAAQRFGMCGLLRPIL